MTNISKHTWIINLIYCYFLLKICQQIEANHSTQFQKLEKNLNNAITNDTRFTLDYYFFSYDIIDHNTLLIKFDLTHTNVFQQSTMLYNAYLYISKLPATNYRINIGLFSDFYQVEIDGTIIDHFTFCLVLKPIPERKKFHNQTQTIFHRYLKTSYQKREQQQQHILHYCTKLGPDDDRHRHHKKQGSGGDHILLLLQIMMIGIFLIVIQIAHMSKKRKFKEKNRRLIDKIRQRLSFRKEHTDVSYDLLKMVRFIASNDEAEVQDEDEDEDEEEQEDVEKDKEDSLTLCHQHFPSSITRYKRSRSPSPTSNPIDNNTKDYSIEHILKSKPWLQIP